MKLMKVYLKGSFIFTAMLLIFALVLVFTSLNYDSDARSIPLGLGIAVSILAIVVLIGERYPRLMSRFGGGLDSLISISPEEKRRTGAVSEQIRGKRVLIMFAWIVGFFLLVFLAGFLIAIPVFTISFLKVRGHIGWINTIAVTAIMYGIAHGVFDVLMRGDLFEGIIFGGILPPI